MAPFFFKHLVNTVLMQTPNPNSYSVLNGFWLISSNCESNYIL